MEPEKYILVKSKTNGLNFYHYLHIYGGSGDNGREEHRNGGEFDYILFYAMSDQMEGCDICPRKWCEEKNIQYAEGATIGAAYRKYMGMIKKSPLTC